MLYPDPVTLFQPDISHRVLTAYAQGFSPNDDAFLRAGIDSEQIYQRLCDGFEAEFATLAKADQGFDHMVLSGEHMHSRLVNPQQVRRLSQFLAPHFAEIRVYIHLRPQVDLARSAASMLARGGGLVSPERYMAIDERSSYYNYLALVQRWQAAFGAEQLRIIPYKKQPSMVAELTRVLGLSEADFLPVARQNTQLDWRVIAMLNAMRPYRKEIFPGQEIPFDLKSLPCEQPLNFGLEVAEQIEARLREGNRALIAMRDELQPGDLSPDWSQFDCEENLSRVNQGAVFMEPMMRVIAQMQQRIQIERFFTRLAESERARLNKREARARHYFLEALELWNGFDEPSRSRAPLQAAKTRVERLSKVFLDNL